MEAIALDWTRERPDASPVARPVVLLHGFASTPRTLAFLARHVRNRLNRPVLRPPLGLGWGDLPAAAKRIDAAIVEAGFDEVDVIGHSLGGLVATELLKNVDCGVRVRRVITLGTPHAGVSLARYAAMATLGFSPAMRQLVPGSKFLAALAERPVPAGSELIAISGDADTLVPERSACIATAARQRWLRLRDVGYLQLVFHRDALALVGELLGAADAGVALARPMVQCPRRGSQMARLGARFLHTG